MMEVKDVLSPQEWAEQTYGAAQLGHVARTRRAVGMAAVMAAEPAGSIPAQQHSQAATKAVYRFCENAHVSYEALMQPHWQQTRADASGCCWCKIPRRSMTTPTPRRRDWVLSAAGRIRGSCCNRCWPLNPGATRFEESCIRNPFCVSPLLSRNAASNERSWPTKLKSGSEQ